MDASVCYVRTFAWKAASDETKLVSLTRIVFGAMKTVSTTTFALTKIVVASEDDEKTEFLGR